MNIIQKNIAKMTFSVFILIIIFSTSFIIVNASSNELAVSINCNGVKYTLPYSEYQSLGYTHNNCEKLNQLQNETTHTNTAITQNDKTNTHYNTAITQNDKTNTHYNTAITTYDDSKYNYFNYFNGAYIYFDQIDNDKTYEPGDDFYINFKIKGEFNDAEIWITDNDGLRNVEFSKNWVNENDRVILSGHIPSNSNNKTFKIQIKAKATLNSDYDYTTNTITIKVNKNNEKYENDTCSISLTNTSGIQEVNAGEIAEFVILTNNNSNTSKKIYYTSNIANANIIPSNISLNKNQSRFSTVQVYTSQSDNAGKYSLTITGQANTCDNATILKYKITNNNTDDKCNIDSKINMRFLNDDTVEAGQTGEFDVKITNTGCNKDNIELFATSETGRTPYFSKEFISLDQNESTIITLYTPTSKTNNNGNYDIRAKAYINNKLVESVVNNLEIEKSKSTTKEANITVQTLNGCKVVDQNKQDETLVTVKNKNNETHKIHLYLKGNTNELNASLQSNILTIKKNSYKKTLVRFRIENIEAGRYYLTVEAKVNDEIIDDDEICIIVKENVKDTTSTSEITITDITKTKTIIHPTTNTEPKKIIEIENNSVEKTLIAIPGKTLTLKATVTNNSNEIMDFTMRAQNLPKGWIYEKNVQTILDGEKREMEITLTPSINNVTDAVIDLTISAKEYIDTKEIFIKTTDSIISKYEIDIITKSKEIREAGLLKAIKILATITNNSKQTANNISPEMTGLAGEFIVTSSPEKITLQPNETKTLTIMLAPKNTLERDYNGGIRFRGSNVLTEKTQLKITKEEKGKFNTLTGFIIKANEGNLLPFLIFLAILLLISAVYLFKNSHSKKQINKIKKMTSYDGGLTEKTVETNNIILKNFKKQTNNNQIHPWSQRTNKK